MKLGEREGTLGELRSSGVRDLIAFCQDYRCGHRVKLSAMVVDEWSDDIVVTRAAVHLWRVTSAAPSCAPAAMGP
ncbi:hypothetical protein [Bradyrhizobium sp. BR 1432]|uniref:hypothetical protein n=1 Tax=Bradyrhizobium sp. BR 1432 TaxID=3447966 RepID=UPI003EE6433F